MRGKIYFTNCTLCIGEVQVVDGVGGDRGGDGILLPLLVRLADQDSCSDEPKADN